MPELPEVETTRRGIANHVIGARLSRITVREPRLRWRIDPAAMCAAEGCAISGITRRGKYLLFELDNTNHLMLHLGMSGALRVVSAATPPGRHDHVDLALDSGQCLRYSDPRRFGSLFLLAPPVLAHPLLRDLGPEPFDPAYNGSYLYNRSRGRRVAVKAFLMDSRTVVGVGNIYANEALYRAGIHPARRAGRIAAARYNELASATRAVLTEAIEAGGTTLRDFTSISGAPGYFYQRLDVYGRAGLPCRHCRAPLRQQRLGQRATTYCKHCQR